MKRFVNLMLEYIVGGLIINLFTPHFLGKTTLTSSLHTTTKHRVNVTLQIYRLSIGAYR